MIFRNVPPCSNMFSGELNFLEDAASFVHFHRMSRFGLFGVVSGNLVFSYEIRGDCSIIKINFSSASLSIIIKLSSASTKIRQKWRKHWKQQWKITSPTNNLQSIINIAVDIKHTKKIWFERCNCCHCDPLAIIFFNQSFIDMFV